MALITLNQQQAIKPISANWANMAKVTGGVTNFANLVDEVENNELASMLGNEFLYAIQKTPTNLDYVKLLDGLEFTTANGNVLKFRGIRYQLAYLVFGKMIEVSHVADSFSGFVQKNRTESESINQGDRRKVQTDARNIAEADFQKMKIYLDENTTTFPLWNCATSKKPNIPKIYGIKKTTL